MTPITGRTRAALLALAALATAHFAAIGPWVVDDAAIAWAYSRNWASGEGLVPFVGGERIEGYSDFLWVALIAVAERVGVDAWIAAKFLSSAMGVLTVPLVYGIAAAAFPRRGVLAGLLAAACFATDTQVAVFGASGLENALFSFLLALGLAGAVRESRDGGVPWSALAFLGIAVTRPEGIAYAAIAGGAALLRAERSRAGASRIATWLALFWVPFAAYHAVRYAYFAWPFPMTYYAKVRTSPTKMFDARSSGWGYLLGYLHELGRLWFLALLPLGRLSLSTDRVLLGLVFAGGAALGFLPFWPPVAFACGWIALGAVLVLPGLADRGARGVSALTWALGLCSVLFSLYAQGDWMGSYRWLSFAAVPLAVVLGSAVAQGYDAVAAQVGPRPAAGAAAVAALAWVATNGRHTARYAAAPDINPFSVRERVAQAEGYWRRLHDDSRPRIMTIDMGGFLWFSPYELMDYVGLCDVTYARQSERHRPELTRDWLLVQKPADLVLVSDDEVGRMRAIDAVADAFINLGPQQLLRRSLLFGPRWTGPGPAVELGGVVVHGLSAPGGPVDRTAYVEVGLSTPTSDPFSARVVLFDAADTAVASWALPLAASFLSPDQWRPGDVALGRYHLSLPPDLPRGRYHLGVRITLDGEALVPDVLPESVTADGTGALRWADATLEVTTPEEARAAADEAVAGLLAGAADGGCATAERAWFLARRRFLDPTGFDRAHAAEVARTLAACWAREAPDVEGLAHARALDRDAPGVEAAAERLADELQAECDGAHDGGAWAECARACDDVMKLSPTRAWTRRTAEACRAHVYDELARESGGGG